MNTIQMMKQQFTEALKTMSTTRCQHEALVGIDFKIDDKRSGLMKLAFSPVASWLLFLGLVLLFINPLRYQFSLLQNASSASPLMMLFDTSAPVLLSFFVLVGVISFFTGLEQLLAFIFAWLLSNGDVHVLVALAAISGAFIGSARKNVRLSTQVEGNINKIFVLFAGLQFVSVVIALVINYILFRNLSQLGYFSRTMYANRLEFLTLAIFLNYFIQLVIYGAWGHFYTKISADPADWKVNYSTSTILKKMNLGRSFKERLKSKTEKVLSETRNFKDQGLVGVPERLQKLSDQQSEYLDQAAKWLTR